jgi:hypothetical protein
VDAAVVLTEDADDIDDDSTDADGEADDNDDCCNGDVDDEDACIEFSLSFIITVNLLHIILSTTLTLRILWVLIVGGVASNPNAFVVNVLEMT